MLPPKLPLRLHQLGHGACHALSAMQLSLWWSTTAAEQSTGTDRPAQPGMESEGISYLQLKVPGKFKDVKCKFSH